jgi:hypothetical protein
MFVGIFYIHLQPLNFNSMGFSNTSTEQINYLKLNAKTDETTSPSFNLIKKGNDGKWGTAESYDQVSGYVIGVSRKEGDWQGNTIYSVRIKFLDDSDNTSKFQVEATYNSLTYSILNALLSLKKDAPVKIRVYSRSSKTDDKMYASAYVESNGARVDWHYQLVDIPKPETGYIGKKKVIDDSNVVEFYHTVVDKLTAIFGSATTQPSQAQGEAEAPTPIAQSRPKTALENARPLDVQVETKPPLIGPDGGEDDLPF